jgi:hypothetical protein
MPVSRLVRFRASVSDGPNRDIVETESLGADQFTAWSEGQISLEHVAFTWVHATCSTSLFFEHLHAFR